jgi:tetratricopeptide (TPR) repeat protein
LEGRDAEAWETYQRGVALEEKLHGPDSVEGLRIRGNMSRLRLRQGRHDEALAYAESALQALQKRLGPEHEMTVFYMVDVGNALRAQGKPAQALELIQRALPLLEKIRGQENPDVGMVLSAMGRAQVDLGQPEQAQASLERALPLLKEARSDDVGATQFALARALTAAKKDSIRARTLAEEAQEGFRKAGPRASRALAEVEAWLARPAPAIRDPQ